MGKVLKSASLGGNDYHIAYPHLSVIPKPPSTKCVAFTQCGTVIAGHETRRLWRQTCFKRTVNLMLHGTVWACSLTGVLAEGRSIYQF